MVKQLLELVERSANASGEKAARELLQIDDGIGIFGALEVRLP